VADGGTVHDHEVCALAGAVLGCDLVRLAESVLAAEPAHRVARAITLAAAVLGAGRGAEDEANPGVRSQGAR
jgi:hypothetical protein